MLDYPVTGVVGYGAVNTMGIQETQYGIAAEAV